MNNIINVYDTVKRFGEGIFYRKVKGVLIAFTFTSCFSEKSDGSGKNVFNNQRFLTDDNGDSLKFHSTRMVKRYAKENNLTFFE